MPKYYNTNEPWRILFQVHGSIWSTVLPYCILNCSLLLFVMLLKEKYDVHIAFSPQGHALMSLIVSYLVVSKINLAFERYMAARGVIGHVLLSLRELNQLAILVTHKDDAEEGVLWRLETKNRILELIDSIVIMTREDRHASNLATADCPEYNQDPFVEFHSLRCHLYNGSLSLRHDLELLERMKLVDLLHECMMSFRDLLKLVSTPLPFPLVQMGRTFLFLWTFSIPFILLGIVNEVLSALTFVFFLTYGYVGLEFVSMKLLSPFGDGVNDLNVRGMRLAVIAGIDKDSQHSTPYVPPTSNKIRRSGLSHDSSKHAGSDGRSSLHSFHDDGTHP